MQKYRLEVKDGELVNEGVMPEFNPKAEVVQWGSRFFVLHEVDADNVVIYREGLMFYLPPE